MTASGRDSGLGQAVGRYLNETHQPAPAFSHLSFICAATRLGIPLTVHVAIGTDIIHMHPSASGAALGEGSLRDFRYFVSNVAELEGGVYLNCGSAVILPEVFLKAVALSRNRGRSLAGLTTVKSISCASTAPDQRRLPSDRRHWQGLFTRRASRADDSAAGRRADRRRFGQVTTTETSRRTTAIDRRTLFRAISSFGRCAHVPAMSRCSALRQCNARYTARVARVSGHRNGRAEIRFRADRSIVFGLALGIIPTQITHSRRPARLSLTFVKRQLRSRGGWAFLPEREVSPFSLLRGFLFMSRYPQSTKDVARAAAALLIAIAAVGCGGQQASGSAGAPAHARQGRHRASGAGRRCVRAGGDDQVAQLDDHPSAGGWADHADLRRNPAIA